jgi:Chemotaxis phosphatase CheX
MSRDTIPLKEWLKAFEVASAEFAAGSMRFDARTEPVTDEATRPGAYIAILSDHNSIHLGLSTTDAGLRTLTRGLLGLRASQDLTEREVADGVSEVMNIVAGKVKSAMSGRDGKLRLGLPMYLPSPIAAGPGMEVVGAELKLGPVPCRLSVYRHTREQRKAA